MPYTTERLARIIEQASSPAIECDPAKSLVILSDGQIVDAAQAALTENSIRGAYTASEITSLGAARSMVRLHRCLERIRRGWGMTAEMANNTSRRAINQLLSSRVFWVEPLDTDEKAQRALNREHGWTVPARVAIAVFQNMVVIADSPNGETVDLQNPYASQHNQPSQDRLAA